MNPADPSAVPETDGPPTAGHLDQEPPVVVADIGGTQCRLALARRQGKGVILERLQVMAAPWGDFADALRRYLAQAGCQRPAAIAVAAAGRVRRGGGRDRIELTNLQLRVEQETLARLTDGGVWLANDLAAVAAALPLLGADEVAGFGSPRVAGRGVRLVIGVGTGFGAAALTDGDDRVVETEAGHVDLAAVSAPERAWWTRLAPSGRLTVEQVLSGPGLLRLHAAVSGQPCPDLKAWRARLEADDPAARETLAVFSGWLGRVAGNFVLGFGAWGGVYLTGGVVAGLGDALDAGAFRRGFEDKAPFSTDLAAVPVHRILHPYPALAGMARLAQPG